MAAPTSKIEVGAIPVVRSESEEASDFADGLFTGLIGAYRIPGLAIAIVDQKRAMFLRGYGNLTQDSKVPLGSLSDIFGALAAMKAVEDGRLRLEDDVSRPLGERDARGATLAQLLDGEKSHPGLLQSAVAKASGQSFADTVNAEIAMPLGMSATEYASSGFTSTAADMSHLMVALVNGGAYMDAPVLQPDTVERMEATHRTLHPGLPGWAYGWTELHRNGTRALVRDGTADKGQSRLVLIPDAKRAYFVAVEGRLPAEFWRLFDDALFDKLVPAHPVSVAATTPALPSPFDARQAAGLYEANGDMLALGHDRIRIRARQDGALLVTGARNVVMAPVPGDLWMSGDWSMKAALVNGRLVINTDQFHPVAIWKRAKLYAWLTLLAAFSALAAGIYEVRAKRAPPFQSEVLLATGGAAIAFALVSALVYFFAPLPA